MHEHGAFELAGVHRARQALRSSDYRKALLIEATRRYKSINDAFTQSRDGSSERADTKRWFNSDDVKGTRIVLQGALLQLAVPTFQEHAFQYPHRQQYNGTDLVTPKFLNEVRRRIGHVSNALDEGIQTIRKQAHASEPAREFYELASAIQRAGEASGAIDTASVIDAMHTAAGTFPTVLDSILPVLAQNEDGAPVTIDEFIRDLGDAMIPQTLARNLPPQQVDAVQTALRTDELGQVHPGFSPHHFQRSRRGWTLSLEELHRLLNPFGQPITASTHNIPKQSIFGCIIFATDSFAEELGLIPPQGDNGYGTFYNLLFKTTAEVVRQTLVIPPPQPTQ